MREGHSPAGQDYGNDTDANIRVRSGVQKGRPWGWCLVEQASQFEFGASSHWGTRGCHTPRQTPLWWTWTRTAAMRRRQELIGQYVLEEIFILLLSAQVLFSLIISVK